MMTKEFGEFISNRPRDWSTEAIHQASRAFVDTIACMVAGRQDAAVQRASRTFEQWSQVGVGMPCVTGQRLPAPWAALVNGAAAHALDYDDVSEPALTHPSAALVPALLALALERKCSGEQIIDAYIVGFEIQAALGAAMNDAHYGRGWHTTLTFGSIAVAAACARLLQLDAKRAAAAVSIATSSSSGSKLQFGTNVKPIHAGMAAQAGIIAASLAEQGVTAAAEVFEGTWSFRSLFGGDSAAGFDAARSMLTGEPAITKIGICLKVHPCCASTHRTIDAIWALKKKGLRLDTIQSITTHVSGIVMGNLMYSQPVDEMQARFSMNHCVALALLEDQIKVKDFYSSRLNDSQTRSLWPLVNMQLDPSLPGKDVINPRPEQAYVVVKKRDGSEMQETIFFAMGHPNVPVSDEALAQKFMACTQDALALVSATGFLHELQDLKKQKNLAFINNRFERIS